MSIAQTGVPNAIVVRALLPTNLKLDKWEELLTKSPDDRELLLFLKFGFPLGYLGPERNSIGCDNHPLAI